MGAAKRKLDTGHHNGLGGNSHLRDINNIVNAALIHISRSNRCRSKGDISCLDGLSTCCVRLVIGMIGRRRISEGNRIGRSIDLDGIVICSCIVDVHSNDKISTAACCHAPVNGNIIQMRRCK